MVKEKLTLVRDTKLVFVVDAPKRFSNRLKSKVKVIRKYKEYLYVPRAYTCCQDTLFTYEEVLAIAKKLKELNEQ